MGFTIDSRIPVILAAPGQATRHQVGPDEAVLTEGMRGLAGFTPAADIAHAAGCACCAQRSPAGRALAALLQARARGEVAFFKRVVVVCTTEGGRAEMGAALVHDPVAASCFRPAS